LGASDHLVRMDPEKYRLSEVAAELAKDGLNEVFLHIDEFHVDMKLAATIIRGCIRSFLSPNLKVYPALSGLQAFTESITDLKGTGWRAKSILLQPFNSDDKNFVAAFFERMNLAVGVNQKDWGNVPELKVLLDDCGGIPRHMATLVDGAKGFPHIWTKQSFGRNAAAKLYNAIIHEKLTDSYSRDRWHEILGGKSFTYVSDPDSFYKNTKRIMVQLALDVLVGDSVDESKEVVVGLNVTYEQCFDRGLVFRKFKTENDPVVPFLSMFGVLTLCVQLRGEIIPLDTVNPFETDFEAFELAAIYSLFARIRWLQMRGTPAGGRWVSLSEIRKYSEVRIVSPLENPVPIQIEIFIEPPSVEFIFVDRNKDPAYQPTDFFCRMTPKNFEALDYCCCLKGRYRIGISEWKTARIKIGGQAKSGEVDCNTTLNQSDVITAVSDAIAVLPQFASEKDDDILVIDIASDRNRQPSDYDWNAFDNELRQRKPLGIHHRHPRFQFLVRCFLLFVII